MLKAVIFDMDGVIVDSEPIYRRIEMNIISDLGLDIPQEEYDSYVGTKTSEMWAQFKEKYGIKQSVEELVEMEARRYIEYITSSGRAKPIPGVKDLIADLHKNGVRLALASSSHVEEINTVLKIFNLESFFELTVSGYQVENGKPAPDIFLFTLKQLSISAQECIVIEDSKNGVEAAKAAGIKCVGFKSVNSGNQDLSSADLVIHNFCEIGYEKLKGLL